MNAGPDLRVTLMVERVRHLGRSLTLLAHYTVVFASFIGRSVEWMVEALKMISLFTRFTASTFDSIYRLLNRRRE